MRHRGGGHKRRIRTVDFSRLAPGKQVVDHIEYDPGRTAHIALLTHTETGDKSYILAPNGMRAGDVVESFVAGISQQVMDAMHGVMDRGILAAKTVIRGNCLPLKYIPIGTTICNIGFLPKGKGMFARSAGTYGQVIEPGGGPKRAYAVVRMSSGEIRKVHMDACATIGAVSNGDHRLERLGKAGRRRWMGWRPQVRGVAMNAYEHPHGGGRGKSKGNVHPKSRSSDVCFKANDKGPWGWKTKGFKTRRQISPVSSGNRKNLVLLC